MSARAAELEIARREIADLRRQVEILTAQVKELKEAKDRLDNKISMPFWLRDRLEKDKDFCEKFYKELADAVQDAKVNPSDEKLDEPTEKR